MRVCCLQRLRKRLVQRQRMGHTLTMSLVLPQAWKGGLATIQGHRRWVADGRLQMTTLPLQSVSWVAAALMRQVQALGCRNRRRQRMHLTVLHLRCSPQSP